MSHNLNFFNGSFSAAFNVSKNGLPWHKLGQMVSGAMTWKDAMEKANLNYEVKLVPFYIKTNGLDTKVPEHFCTIRTDITSDKSILGVVGSKYTPIQNDYMFSFVDSMLESIDGAHYESAGALGNGERVWCLAKIPFDFSIKEDKHETYLLFEGSHDGTKSCTVMLTDVRVVCQNTLNIALNSRGIEKIKIRHTEGAKNKLDSIREAWTGIQQNVDTIKNKFSLMTQKKITSTDFDKTMKTLLGGDWQDSTRKQNIGLEIARIFKNNDHSAYPEQAGTAYNLLNSITNYADHKRSVRTDGGQITESVARAEACTFGSGEQMKEKALEAVYSLCNMSSVPETTNNKSGSSVDRILDMINY